MLASPRAGRAPGFQFWCALCTLASFSQLVDWLCCDSHNQGSMHIRIHQ